MMDSNIRNPSEARGELMVALVKILAVLGFLGTPPQLAAQVSTASQNSFLPELEIIEFRENFKAGSVGNAVIFRVENTTAFPVTSLNLRPQLPAQYLLLDRITPNNVDLEPGEVVEITAEFSVRADAEVGAEDQIGFHFDTESAYLLPASRYRLIAVIDEGDKGAECNSAVEAGGDAGGGVSVDLGGFAGLAGFSWEMYGIKDQMNVSVGGVQKTTGCVSGTGTFEFNIPPGATTATVEVLPNCEQTSGTQWNFTFECPLSSDVTADGSGNTLIADDDGAASQPGGLAPTAVGAPVTPAAPVPPALGPTGVWVAEAEPNDGREDATPINIGDQISGTIERNGDGDTYIAAVSHQGELTVSFSSIPANINIAFRVLDEAGHLVRNWQTAPVFGGTYAATVDLKRPGRYMIEVRDGSNNAFSTSPYTMATSFIPTADPAEINDALESATPLGWNQMLASNILPLGDVDYFKVEARKQGQLTLNFTSMPPALNMAFRILGENGQLVKNWQTAPISGAPFQEIADLPAPGRYFVEVRDGSNNARAAAPYEMLVSLNPTLDRAEPNNTIDAASVASFNAPIWASILPLGDVDYYKVNVSHQGQLTVDFTRSPANLNMTFRVLNENGALVRNWQTAPTQGGAFSGWADIETPGVYFVEVRDGSNNARASDPYGMVVSFVPTADTAEPNNTITSATPLGFNQALDAAILPLGDADFYLVSARRQGELTVDFSVAPDDLNMAFRVLTAQGALVKNWQTAPSNGATFSAWADLPSPGDYLIEVRDGSNNMRAVESYSLVARFIETLDPQEPNNAVETATPLTAGARLRASILPLGDADFYVFTASQAGELIVRFDEMPENLNMAFRLLSAQGALVQNWQTAPEFGTSFTATAEIPSSGQFVLEVRDGSNNARSPAPYRLSISVN